jgi:hypothetical protein
VRHLRESSASEEAWDFDWTENEGTSSLTWHQVIPPKKVIDDVAILNMENEKLTKAVGILTIF